MLADVLYSPNKEAEGKFRRDLLEESPYRACVIAQFSIGCSFSATRITYTENNNRSEDYSIGFIID